MKVQDVQRIYFSHTARENCREQAMLPGGLSPHVKRASTSGPRVPCHLQDHAPSPSPRFKVCTGNRLFVGIVRQRVEDQSQVATREDDASLCGRHVVELLRRDAEAWLHPGMLHVHRGSTQGLLHPLETVAFDRTEGHGSEADIDNGQSQDRANGQEDGALEIGPDSTTQRAPEEEVRDTLANGPREEIGVPGDEPPHIGHKGHLDEKRRVHHKQDDAEEQQVHHFESIDPLQSQEKEDSSYARPHDEAARGHEVVEAHGVGPTTLSLTLENARGWCSIVN